LFIAAAFSEERTIVSEDKPGDGKDTLVTTALPPKLQAAIAGQKAAASTAAAAASAVPGPASEKEELQGYSHFKEHYGELLDRFSKIRDMDATRVSSISFSKSLLCYIARFICAGSASPLVALGRTDLLDVVW
jgi:hypothetical protein